MKILSAQQIREADAYTILNEPVASADLMERAAHACTDWIKKNTSPENSFTVFCGHGNNGGDGLAVARLLSKIGRMVSVVLVQHDAKKTKDYLLNEKRLSKISSVKILRLNEKNIDKIFHDLDAKKENHRIIDALFGTGLSRPSQGIFSQVIHAINRLNLPVISIDIPSGLFCDQSSSAHVSEIVRATTTLSFEFPKAAFVMPENEPFVGDWVILPIRLHPDFIDKVKSKMILLTSDDLHNVLKKRSKFSHKGKHGHALLCAGSKGKMGAAVIASRACLRSGVGVLTVHIPDCGTSDLSLAVSEAMTDIDPSSNHLSEISINKKYTSIGIGPGIGTHKETQQALKLLIQNSASPLVLDADALNILSENKTWLSFLPAGSILTPHPLEFERIAGRSENDFERNRLQIATSVKLGVYIVLKGAYTCISTPDGTCYFNTSGNPAMAKAGSGDALTGVITSLMAQGYGSLKSALLGVYLHGLAGDLALRYSSVEALTASDLIEHLPHAFNELRNLKLKK